MAPTRRFANLVNTLLELRPHRSQSTKVVQRNLRWGHIRWMYFASFISNGNITMQIGDVFERLLCFVFFVWWNCSVWMRNVNSGRNNLISNRRWAGWHFWQPLSSGASRPTPHKLKTRTSEFNIYKVCAPKKKNQLKLQPLKCSNDTKKKKSKNVTL